LVDVGYLRKFVFFDVVLAAFMALFENFFVAYLESFTATIPAMRSTMISRIAKARGFFH
jgi:hypothetical protein